MPIIKHLRVRDASAGAAAGVLIACLVPFI